MQRPERAGAERRRDQGFGTNGWNFAEVWEVVADQLPDAQAFVHGLHAVMLLSIIVCALSVPAALWGRDKAKKDALHLPHLAHPLWPHLWKRVPVSQ